MNSISTKSSTAQDAAASAASMVDSAAESADHVVRSSQRVANEAMDHLADRIDEVRSQSGQALGKLAADAERLARRGVDAVRERSQRLSNQAARAGDTTIGYIKDEPVKSVLIAAAAGAALMALISLSSRSRSRD